MPKVVEHTHENDKIKLLPERGHIPDGETSEIDVQALNVCGKSGLTQVMLVAVDTYDPVSAPRASSPCE